MSCLISRVNVYIDLCRLLADDGHWCARLAWYTSPVYGVSTDTCIILYSTYIACVMFRRLKQKYRFIREFCQNQWVDSHKAVLNEPSKKYHKLWLIISRFKNDWRLHISEGFCYTHDNAFIKPTLLSICCIYNKCQWLVKRPFRQVIRNKCMYWCVCARKTQLHC